MVNLDVPKLDKESDLINDLINSITKDIEVLHLFVGDDSHSPSMERKYKDSLEI